MAVKEVAYVEILTEGVYAFADLFFFNLQEFRSQCERNVVIHIVNGKQIVIFKHKGNISERGWYLCYVLVFEKASGGKFPALEPLLLELILRYTIFCTLPYRR